MVKEKITLIKDLLYKCADFVAEFLGLIESFKALRGDTVDVVKENTENDKTE